MAFEKNDNSAANKKFDKNLLKNIKRVSVDFDGVLMRMLLGREWVRFTTSYKTGNNLLFIFDKNLGFVGNHWLRFIHKFRKRTPGSDRGLKFFNEIFDEVLLLTSRRDYLSKATTEWLKLHGLYEYFLKLVFRDIEKIPWDFKVFKVGELEIDLHIDDDYKSMVLLAETYPAKVFIYFSSERGKKIDAPNVVTVFSWDEILGLFR